MTADIKIIKLNETYLRLEADSGILMEISESFVFDVPGAKYSPKFKAGIWDGKIRLFNVGKRTIYTGLFSEIVEFCSQRNYTYEVIQSSYGTPGEVDQITYEEVSQYIQGLNLHGGGSPVNVRDYQVNGVHLALAQKSGIINAATGSGKSLIIYAITRYLVDELELRVLIVVPTVSLTTQLLNDFNDYSSANGWDATSHVHLISSGASKDTRKPIVISTFQSIYKQGPEWINSFGCIFTDEGHKVTASSIIGLYERGTEVKYRLACTGTLHDMQCNILVMKGLTGNVHKVATTKDLIQNKQLVDLHITAIQLKYSPEVCKAFKKSEYDDEIKYLVNLSRRNNFIKNLAIKCSGTTLVLFRFIEQGKALQELISEAANDRPVYYIDGSVKSDIRETIRIAANSEDSIIIASYGVFSAGVNLPAIENIIFGSPLKSKIANLQSIGRGLRLKSGKSSCRLYDIGDDLSSKSYVNFAMRHFGERLKMYSQEGFTFKFVNLPI